MHEVYNNFLFEIHYLRFYYEYRRQAAYISDLIFTALPLVIAAGGLTFFLNSAGLTIVGTLILLTGQALSVINHLLPFGKKVQSLTTLISELTLIAKQADYTWNNIEVLSSEQISDRIFEYETRIAQYESRNSAVSPQMYSKRDALKASDSAKQYLISRYGLDRT